MPEQINKRVKSDINAFKINISAYYHTRMEAIVFIFLQDFLHEASPLADLLLKMFYFIVILLVDYLS